MAWYFIEPCDVLMFRDGRPFSAGESHLIQSLFPPTALSVQGALRAMLMRRDGYLRYGRMDAAHPMVGMGDDDLGDFAMHGPYLALHEQAYRERGQRVEKYIQYVPLPSDVVYTKDGTYARLSPTTPSPASGANWPDNLGLWPLRAMTEIDDLPGECWLPSGVFNTQYLSGGILSEGHAAQYDGIYRGDGLYADEPRFGIGMRYTARTVEESMLYRAAFKRMADNVGLLVWVSDAVPLLPDPDAELTIPLGGEGHAARLRFVPDDKVQAVSQDLPGKFNEGSQGLKLVLTTPAWLENGWGSRSSIWNNCFEKGVVPELVAAAIPRPQSVGGWNAQANKQAGMARPMIRLVPPGSVFYFRGHNLPKQDFSLTQNTPGFPSLDRLGYGRFAVAEW